ncbi:MAG TPA: PAS domain S-box protein [Syntrophorhabdaceae bacterium]|nr:PAS domain S-box protein [Syntrophorhabdaceae bacterium]
MSDSIYRNLTNVYYEIDEQWRFTTVNDRAVETFQRRREDLLGKSLFDVLLRKEDSIIADNFKIAVDEQRPVHFELESIRYPGMWVELHAYPLARGLSVFSQDITERKKTEEALRKTEKNLRMRMAELTALIDVSLDGIVIYDKYGRIASQNEYADRLFSFLDVVTSTSETFEERSWKYDCRLPDGSPLKMQDAPVYRALHGEAVRDKVFYIMKDGEMLWLSASAAPLRTDSGEIFGAVASFRDVTAQKRAEEDIQREKDRLAAVLNGIQDDILFVDTQGKIVLANPAAIRNLDFQITDKFRISDLMDRFELRSADGNIITVENGPSQRAMRDHPVNNEEQVLRFAGTSKEKYVDVSSSPVKDLSNNIIGAVIIARDITQRKQVERELSRVNEDIRIDRQRLRTVLETIPSAVVIVDVNGKFIYINQRARQLYGMNYFSFELEDHVDHVRVLRPDGSPFPVEEMPVTSSLRDGRLVHGIEMTIERPDGVRVPIIVGSAPLYNNQGNINGAVVAFDDITGRKQAENAMKESEERFKALSETSPIGVGVSSAENILIYANPAYERILGYGPDELLGRKSEDVYWSPADRKSWLRTLREDGVVRDFEVRLRRKDGTPLWVSVNASAIRFGGEPAVMGTIQNITERKQAEEELRKSRDELEIRVRERTAELRQAYDELHDEMQKHEEAEQRLRQSQKMEAIGTLAGGIAHDFNNILAGILGFTEMALEDVQDQPQVEKSLSYVLRSAKRGRDLVKQILAFSRKTEYQREPVSVTPIVKETMQLLRASIPATIDIRSLFTAEQDTIVASPTEIQQILMDLSTNAFMAMEEKGGTLEIGLSDACYPYMIGRQSSAEFLELTVRDTGVGMTPEIMQRAFDPFFTTREPGKGTGMGLSVVYGIVRDLGGEISVSSEPGEGTTFSIFLPKTEIEARKEQGTTFDIMGGTEVILLVEDEEMIIEWGKDVLGKLGYTVHAFPDPQKALLAFAANPSIFHLVITDQAMPKMAGSQLASGIHSLRKDIPIILCTGYQEPISPEKVAEIGITEVLSKPLTKYELAAAVRRGLDQKRTGK